jgi:hypothetical protein
MVRLAAINRDDHLAKHGENVIFLRTCLVECLKPKVFATERRVMAHKRYQTPISPEDRDESEAGIAAMPGDVRVTPMNRHRHIDPSHV